jgi:hypothetical protein
MRKKAEKNGESAGKNCDPLNGNNDFTPTIEIQHCCWRYYLTPQGKLEMYVSVLKGLT